MTKKDVDIFIEEMRARGDECTPDRVEEIYGDRTLEDALNERKSSRGIFENILNFALGLVDDYKDEDVLSIFFSQDAFKDSDDEGASIFFPSSKADSPSEIIKKKPWRRW